jgi:hypothetical protein
MNQPAKEMEYENEKTEIESDLEETISRLEAETETDEEVEDDGLQGQEQETEPEKQEAEPEESEEEVTDEAEPKREEPQQRPRVSPPVDWPEEEFSKLPQAAQQRIHNREVQVSQLLQQTAEQRRMADTFMKVVEPFKPLMAAEGVRDPIQAVQGLMNTTALLATGQPQQKAHKIAELVRHYNIDIEELDKALAGETQKPQMSPFEQQLAQRMAGMEQHFQMQEQQRQQAMQGRAAQNIEQFASDPKNEYFPEVRTIMADFLDIATRNGQIMSLEEAYNRACAVHPEISQRIAQKRAQQHGPNATQKRKAASSVKGSAGTSPEPESTEGMDIRDILERQIPGGDGRI